LPLKARGWSQRSIADALGASEVTVSRWLARARRGGPEALHARPAPGRPPKLPAAQKRLIPDFLWHGAEAYGFRGEVWTCARVAAVIREEFGVAYHKGHVSRLLKELRWTPPLPITRAIQRDEEAIERWRAAVWPELRPRARREGRTVVFVDEAGFYLLPGVVKAYAPQGLRPVVWERPTRDPLSVMGGVAPAGKVDTLVRQASLTGRQSIRFLEHLPRAAGDRLLVIWGGSPIHRRAGVHRFVARMQGRVCVEALPGYAPDLNPVEGLGQHLKHVEMRNVACVDLEELHQEFHLAVGRVRQEPHLVRSFFAGAGLEIKRT
jgi:transposase